jgi:putative phosphoribosyl transferase
MSLGHALFRNRRDAGQQLAEALKLLRLDDPLVLALPRGGVPVGFEVAQALHAPLDIMLVRKIGAPDFPELGIGAVADGHDPQTVLNESAMAMVHPPAGYIEAESRRQLEEIERRRKAYLGGRAPVDVKNRTVILVDDGIATGGTVKVALQALRRSQAGTILLAVPVAPQSALDELRDAADQIVCLATPYPFRAVGLHYADFEQTTDEEVVTLLDAARQPGCGTDATTPPQQGAP